MTAEESRGARIRKKLIGRSSWFKSRQKDKDTQEKRTGVMGTRNQEAGASGHVLKTRSVLFVPQTPGGELAKRTREVLERLQPILGYKVRVVERTGTGLQQKLSQTSIWSGLACGRGPCVTCNQGGEDLPLCTRSSVVYENICVICNPSAKNKGELEEQEQPEVPSLYVGESGRSIQERALEHWADYRRGDDSSHIRKHQGMVHPGEEPQFQLKVISYPRSALSRQIQEAVRIRRRGGASSILNSKAEYNRCHIPRLVVEKEDEEAVKKSLEDEKERRMKEQREMDVIWEESKFMERDRKERKRKNSVVDMEDPGTGRRRKKRRTYPKLKEEWGEDVEDDHWVEEIAVKDDSRGGGTL